jgi:hypothetical protein
LKDQAFSTLLDQNPPFELRAELSFGSSAEPSWSDCDRSSDLERVYRLVQSKDADQQRHHIDPPLVDEVDGRAKFLVDTL